jgi:hypothetical protein
VTGLSQLCNRLQEERKRDNLSVKYVKDLGNGDLER